jgi:hypothetical protein
MSESSEKPTIVIHLESVRRGAVVAPGFFEWVEGARDHYQLAIFSPRASDDTGVILISMWLHEQRNHWIAAGGQRHPTEPLTIQIGHEKPADAWLTIDDPNVDWGSPWLTLEALLGVKRDERP